MAEARLAIQLADLHHGLLGPEPTTTTFIVDRATANDANLELIITGAGFDLLGTVPSEGNRVELQLRRLLTLPDWVAPEMDVLVCGLNPSPYSVETGVGFGRPGNRFWPAAIEAGLVVLDRDPRDALLTHRVGMTDLVKRPTRRADELTRDEYRAGVARVEEICVRYEPNVLCVVGLAGWRAAVDRTAVAGRQSRLLGPTRVFLMGSTSGLNAHATVASLTDDLVSVKRWAKAH